MHIRESFDDVVSLKESVDADLKEALNFCRRFPYNFERGNFVAGKQSKKMYMNIIMNIMNKEEKIPGSYGDEHGVSSDIVLK